MKNREKFELPVLTAYLDLLCNVAIIILLAYFLTIPLVNPVTKKIEEGVRPNAQMVITATWTADADVDLWVENPLGHKLWFNRMEIGMMHLDVDNRGNNNNKLTLPNGEVITTAKFQEIATVRGWIPGEYTVNIHLYRAKTTTGGDFKTGERLAIPVEMTVLKLNPKVEPIVAKTLVLERVWQEATLVRFTVDREGTVTNVRYDFHQLVESAKPSTSGVNAP